MRRYHQKMSLLGNEDITRTVHLTVHSDIHPTKYFIGQSSKLVALPFQGVTVLTNPSATSVYHHTNVPHKARRKSTTTFLRPATLVAIKQYRDKGGVSAANVARTKRGAAAKSGSDHCGAVEKLAASTGGGLMMELLCSVATRAGLGPMTSVRDVTGRGGNKCS